MQKADVRHRLSRESGFSFQCAACGQCCHDKEIQLNPFEIVSMSHYLRKGSTEFLEKYVRREKPYLLFREDGGCVFLEDGRCAVHTVRPLACRLYPLGQHLTGEGAEHFKCGDLHPECTGVPGDDGTVSDFLASQGTLPYMEASNRYLELFYRCYRMMYRRLEEKSGPGKGVRRSGDSRPLGEWFDVDRIVARWCDEKGRSMPAEPVQRMNLHIEALEEKIAVQTEVLR